MLHSSSLDEICQAAVDYLKFMSTLRKAIFPLSQVDKSTYSPEKSKQLYGVTGYSNTQGSIIQFLEFQVTGHTCMFSWDPFWRKGSTLYIYMKYIYQSISIQLLNFIISE